MYRQALFFVFFQLLIVNVFSQAPQLGVAIEDEFKATNMPDKWKNESAVIIGQKTNTFSQGWFRGGTIQQSSASMNIFINASSCRIKMLLKNFRHLIM